nr:filamentous hemagglutinin N-terminal domain-containing protein [Pantoea sp. 1.19]
MNKQCYCLIYSRTHGELRVVSELVRSNGGGSGRYRAGGTPRLWVTLRRAGWLLALALFAPPVLADGIVADGRAPAAQRPEVIATQNGLPQVNITAPNPAGISHNQFTQFDVGANGAILNNSAVMTSTQLAGMIQGNANLHPGSAPARVILNEVNSSDPSQLRGYLEVAGGRAQVIIANPAGILCDGCGTLNAGRMTLTTGKPQLNADGSLAGWQVERGQIRIGRGGLNGDARQDTDYVDILARAVEINGGVRAKQALNVVAGRNQIAADASTVTPLGDGGERPALAIDMGQMGGMYSGQIRMIATEAGVGVRNQGGHLQAGKTLTVSSEGQLVWQSIGEKPVTEAAGDIQLSARQDIDHHGKLWSGGTLRVESREGALRQSGTLAAAGDVTLQAATDIESSGHLLAGSDANSTLVRPADLSLRARGQVQASGSLLSQQRVSVRGAGVDLSHSTLAAKAATLSAGQHDVAVRQATLDSGVLRIDSAADVDARQAQVRAGEWAVSARDLRARDGVWTQVGGGESRFNLTGLLDNRDGTIEANALGLDAAALDNGGGRLVALGQPQQHWRISGLLDNRHGELGANGDLSLAVGDLNNASGSLLSQASLSLSAAGDIENTAGRLLAGQQLTLDAAGVLNNLEGQISAASLQLSGQQLNNHGGTLFSSDDLTLTAAQTLDNRQGQIGAQGTLTLSAGVLDNRDGSAQAGQQLAVAAQQVNNAGGKLLADRQLTLSADEGLNNQRGTLGGQTVDIAVQTLANTGGKVLAQQSLVLDAQRVDNAAGSLLAVDRLSLQAADGLSNRGGSISANTLTLSGGFWDNALGTIVAERALSLQAQQGLNNQDGWLEAGGALTLVSQGGIDNRRGTAQGGSGVGVTTDRLDNRGGRLQSGGALTLDSTDSVNNQGGTLTAQQALSWQGDKRGAVRQPRRQGDWRRRRHAERGAVAQWSAGAAAEPAGADAGSQRAAG